MFVSCSNASILHADLDSFYASVEQRDDPRLRGRPVIVGAGVVLAASYEAKARGIRTAMGGAPGAAAVPARRWSSRPGCRRTPRPARRCSRCSRTPRRWSRACRSTRRSSTSGGCDHISGTPVEIAARLRRRIREEVGLPITVGVARTKFLAKVASAVAKPDGLLVVAPDGELAFLHPLPVERLWGVGRVTAEKLRQRGITTVGQVALLAERDLVAMLGRASGRHLHALAHNYDPGRWRFAAGGARSAPSARSGGAGARRRSWPGRCSRWWTGWRGGCARRTGCAGRSSCGCASRTSRARPGPTPCARRPIRPTRSSRPPPDCSGRRGR